MMPINYDVTYRVDGSRGRYSPVVVLLSNGREFDTWEPMSDTKMSLKAEAWKQARQAAQRFAKRFGRNFVENKAAPL